MIDNLNGKEFKLCAPAGERTCSYREELTPISLALQKLQHTGTILKEAKEARINLFTDLRSAVKKLAHKIGNEVLIHTILGELEMAAVFGNPNIVFQWIPSHCEVDGNERVDEFSK